MICGYPYFRKPPYWSLKWFVLNGEMLFPWEQHGRFCIDETAIRCWSQTLMKAGQRFWVFSNLSGTTLHFWHHFDITFFWFFPLTSLFRTSCPISAPICFKSTGVDLWGCSPLLAATKPESPVAGDGGMTKIPGCNGAFRSHGATRGIPMCQVTHGDIGIPPFLRTIDQHMCRGQSWIRFRRDGHQLMNRE